MKEVLINGVTYLPASALAKDFRYTTDYIGQLCRSKKVDAQLVGRSWYVNPLSLAALRQKRYSRVGKSAVEPTEVAEDVAYPVAVQVQSPMAKATVKMQAAPQATNFAKRIDWKPVRYEDDQAELLPALSKESHPTMLKVGLADSSDIAIKTSSKSTTLVPDAMPSVVLKGRVTVASLEEVFDVVEDDLVVTPTFSEPVPQPKLVPRAEKPLVRKAPVRPSLKIAQPLPVEAPVVTRFNSIEWFLVVVNVSLLMVGGLVAFSELSLSATASEFVQNFEFESASLQALLGQYFR